MNFYDLVEQFIDAFSIPGVALKVALETQLTGFLLYFVTRDVRGLAVNFNFTFPYIFWERLLQAYQQFGAICVGEFFGAEFFNFIQPLVLSVCK